MVNVTPGLYISDLTAPNLVGDSNVRSQPDQGPRVFTIGAKVTNPSLNTLTDVMIYLGDGETAGVFPVTNMSLGQTHNTYQGSFDLNLLAGRRRRHPAADHPGRGQAGHQRRH